MSPIGFELVSRNGKPITTIDDWHNDLNKREQTKFVPGYSAYETARAWTEPNRVPAEVAALFERPPLDGFSLNEPSLRRKPGSTSTAARVTTICSSPPTTTPATWPSLASSRR
jgi:hypothetical protein